MVNIVARWARELSVPGVDSLPRYFMNDPKPGEKFHIDIASGNLVSSFTASVNVDIAGLIVYGESVASIPNGPTGSEHAAGAVGRQPDEPALSGTTHHASQLLLE